MALQIKRAVKAGLKLRMAISGQSGGGKTFTSLTMGTRLAELCGGIPCVIDTERGSSLRFADRFTFDQVDLDPPYSPDHYLAIVREVEAAGYPVIIIDSLSHAWEDEGGILDIHTRLTAANPKHDGFAAWREAKPIQRKFVDALFRSRAHLICTIRDKQGWEVTRDENGRAGVHKLSLKPVQGDDLEYEFDIWGDMDRDNVMLISKSRMIALAERKAIRRPTQALAEEIHAWLTAGGEAEAPKPMPSVTSATPGPTSSSNSNGAGPASLDASERLTHEEFAAAYAKLGYDAVRVATALGATDGADPKRALLAWYNANGRDWWPAIKLLRNIHEREQKPSDQLRETGEPEPDEQPPLMAVPVERSLKARGA